MIFNREGRIIDNEKKMRGPKPKKGPHRTVEKVCNELKGKKYKKLRILNLSGNYIGDEGAKILGELFEESNLEKLKILDISSNRISERGLLYFTPLLERPNFKYLAIYGNEGATQEGVSKLRRRLKSYGVKGSLSKIIWVPEEWIDDAEEKGNLCSHHAEVYRNYFRKH
jgi:Leucine-rich repeat (LRR) protein